VSASLTVSQELRGSQSKFATNEAWRGLFGSMPLA